MSSTEASGRKMTEGQTATIGQDEWSQSRVSKRRSKPQLSCVSCRQKKLKCDRQRPCKNCEKYSPGSCVYIPLSSQSRKNHDSVKPKARSHNTLRERIQQLESLVQSLAKGTAEEPAHHGASDEQHLLNSAAKDSMQLSTDATGTEYLGPAHWGVLLNSVDQLKEALAEDEGEDAQSEASAASDEMLPELLFGSPRNDSLMEIICSMPAKSVCDKILALFIESVDIPSFTFHIPTLRKEYDIFWKDPEHVAPAWLAILNGLIAFTLQFAMRSDLAIDGVMYPTHLAELSTSRVARLLVLSDYTKPKQHIVEAMLIYCICEHFRTNSDFKIQLLFSLVFRLAIRAGYHRDPSHYPQISVFEGEIRRRVWAVIAQFEYITAFSSGLPSFVDESKIDTRPPGSFLDEDLFPEMTELPATLPNHEPNWVTYCNFKLAWLRMLSKVIDKMNAVSELSYAEALEIDGEITQMVEETPSWLSLSHEQDLRKLSPTTITRLCFVFLVEQRARILLHRHFLARAWQDKSFEASRQICLSSAARTLRYQNELYTMREESNDQTAGNWRFFSFMAHDLVLAAVILCIDVNQSLRQGSPDELPEPERQAVLERIDLLAVSYKIWTGLWRHSAEARAAAGILRRILKKNQRDILSIRSGTNSVTPDPTDDRYNLGELDSNELRIYAEMLHSRGLFNPMAASSDVDNLADVSPANKGGLEDLVPGQLDTSDSRTMDLDDLTWDDYINEQGLPSLDEFQWTGRHAQFPTSALGF